MLLPSRNAARRLVQTFPPGGQRLIKSVLRFSPRRSRVERSHARLIALTANAEIATNVILPRAAQAGDFAVIVAYVSAGVVGGSGTAWADSVTGSARISRRPLELADFPSPLALTFASPHIVAVFRPSRRVSALNQRTSHSYSGAGILTSLMEGFIKSDDAMTMLGVIALSAVGAPDFRTGDWTHIARTGADSWWVTVGVRERINTYVDGHDLGLVCNASAPTKYAAAFELSGD